MARIGSDFGHGENTFPPNKGLYKGGTGYEEHHANVRVGLALEAKLKAAGHTIVRGQEPRKNDVNLTTRTNKYFAENVDLIVSYHANANHNKSANGYAAFYWHTDSTAKKLADLYEDEIKKQGFKLWGGSRPSRPNDWSNFHMCRIPASKGVPSILLENGFMTNDNDFEWIFGSKKDEYAERCATAAFNAIQRFLGESTNKSTPSKPNQTTPSAPKPSTSNNSVVDYLIAQGTDSSFANRKKLASQHGISNYTGTASQNTQLLNKLKSNTPKQSAPKQNTSSYTGSSVVDYLSSIKADSSFSNRSKLAKQHGISNYSGTSSQNTQLLNKLRAGSKPVSAPAKKGDQKTTSLVDYLKSIKEGSSFANRKKLAGQNGINNYTGTASQNTQLLNKLRK